MVYYLKRGDDLRIIKSPEDRREEILNGATDIFLSKGFGKTTIDDIVNRLNISKGLVFYYYKSKEELISAVIERLAVNIAQPAICIMKSNDEFTLKLTKALQYFIGFALSFKDNFENMVGEDNLRVMGRFHEIVFKNIEPYLTELTSQGIEQGYINNLDALNSIVIIFMGSMAYLSLHTSDSDFDFEKFLFSAVNTLEMSLGMINGSLKRQLIKI